MTDLYVYPNQLRTAIASHQVLRGPIGNEDETVYSEWKKQPGDYLYLHPYWYTFDEASTLVLVGRGAVKLANPYGTPTTTEDMRIDLETLLDMPIGEKVGVTYGELNSMMVFTTNSDEPEKMFHPGDYICLDVWLYQVNKKMILAPVGRTQSPWRNERIDECLALIHQHNPSLANGGLYLASEDAWGVRQDLEHERRNYDGALPNVSPLPLNVPSSARDKTVERIMDTFKKELLSRKRKPVIGDHIKVVTPEGYKVEAHCVPDPGLVAYDPSKGKPFVLAVTIYNPDGTKLIDGPDMPTAPVVA